MTQICESKIIGQYANYLIVGHNAFEFVLDFGQLYNGDQAQSEVVRIVTAPVYAKAMLEAIRHSVEHFESAYGSISTVSEDKQ